MLQLNKIVASPESISYKIFLIRRKTIIFIFSGAARQRLLLPILLRIYKIE
jgi:hypothetical protein